PILCSLRQQTQFLWPLVLSHGHHRKPPTSHSGRAGRHPLQGIQMIMLFRESYYLTKIINKHAAEDALFAADDGTAAVWMLRHIDTGGQPRTFASPLHGNRSE